MSGKERDEWIKMIVDALSSVIKQYGRDMRPLLERLASYEGGRVVEALAEILEGGVMWAEQEQRVLEREVAGLFALGAYRLALGELEQNSAKKADVHDHKYALELQDKYRQAMARLITLMEHDTVPLDLIIGAVDEYLFGEEDGVVERPKQLAKSELWRKVVQGEELTPEEEDALGTAMAECVEDEVLFRLKMIEAMEKDPEKRVQAMREMWTGCLWVSRDLRAKIKREGMGAEDSAQKSWTTLLAWGDKGARAFRDAKVIERARDFGLSVLSSTLGLIGRTGMADDVGNSVVWRGHEDVEALAWAERLCIAGRLQGLSANLEVELLGFLRRLAYKAREAAYWLETGLRFEGISMENIADVIWEKGDPNGVLRMGVALAGFEQGDVAAELRKFVHAVGLTAASVMMSQGGGIVGADIGKVTGEWGSQWYRTWMRQWLMGLHNPIGGSISVSHLFLLAEGGALVPILKGEMAGATEGFSPLSVPLWYMTMCSGCPDPEVLDYGILGLNLAFLGEQLLSCCYGQIETTGFLVGYGMESKEDELSVLDGLLVFRAAAWAAAVVGWLEGLRLVCPAAEVGVLPLVARYKARSCSLASMIGKEKKEDEVGEMVMDSLKSVADTGESRKVVGVGVASDLGEKWIRERAEEWRNREGIMMRCLQKLASKGNGE